MKPIKKTQKVADLSLNHGRSVNNQQTYLEKCLEYEVLCWLIDGYIHEVSQPLCVIRMVTDTILIRNEKGALPFSFIHEKTGQIADAVELILQSMGNIRKHTGKPKETISEYVDPIETIRLILLLIRKKLNEHNIILKYHLNDPSGMVKCNRTLFEKATLYLFFEILLIQSGKNQHAPGSPASTVIHIETLEAGEILEIRLTGAPLLGLTPSSKFLPGMKTGITDHDDLAGIGYTLCKTTLEDLGGDLQSGLTPDPFCSIILPLINFSNRDQR